MRVLALVPNQRGYSPGQRGSIELWEKVLSPAGIEVVFAPFETEKLRTILNVPGRQFSKAAEMVRSYMNRLRILSSIEDYDAVFVYREAALLGPALIERMITRKRPIIYQLDDPLYIPYRSPWNGYLSYLKFFGKIKEIIRLSKIVIVNSSHIRDFALQYNTNVRQIPSVIDTDKFVYRGSDQITERVCVGWSGSKTTVRNIKMIEGPLRSISTRKVCEIHFIGGRSFDLDGVDHSSQLWNSDSEVEDLRRIQIGLIPLPDIDWNREKFIMKTAQYMALGIVPIGTPIASNPEVIRHGENGFLADNDDDWIRYIELLADDADLRVRMSKVAAKDAQDNYSLRANESRIVDAFQCALS